MGCKTVLHNVVQLTGLFLPVAHGWGGGGGWIHPHILLKNEFLTNCLLFGNTKFIVTANWLQLSAYTVWKPRGCKSYHNFKPILSVLNIFFFFSQTLLVKSCMSFVYRSCTTARKHLWTTRVLGPLLKCYLSPSTKLRCRKVLDFHKIVKQKC